MFNKGEKGIPSLSLREYLVSWPSQRSHNRFKAQALAPWMYFIIFFAGNHAFPCISISVISLSSVPKSHHSQNYNQAIKYTCQQIIRPDLLEFQGFIFEESSAFDLFVLILHSLLVLHIKHCLFLIHIFIYIHLKSQNI